jgi:hypothetical protein
MKVVGLATPEELRIQMATDEVFRVLTGGEGDQSTGAEGSGAELESSSSNIGTPAVVEVFRVLTGGEADRSTEAEGSGVELESSSLNAGTPAVVEAFRILSGGEADHSANERLVEPDRSAEPPVDVAELGHLSKGTPVIANVVRLVHSDKADHSAEERLIAAQSENSFLSEVGPSDRPKRRFSVFTIATAALVSFGLGVLASQLFQDDSVSSNEATAAAGKLEQERQRTTQLTTELTAARHNFEAQLQLSGDAIYEVTHLKKSVEAVTALLQQEREKTAELMRRLETAQPSIAACDAPDCVAKGPREPAAAVAHPPTTEKKMDPELVRLMGRANELLAQGNINGARTALERAVEMGSARASFIIAETYDPRVLSGWKTFGTRGDLSKAREFYAKAAAGGIEEAKERLASLARN